MHMEDETFGFEAALEAMKHGFGVRRTGWNGVGMTVRAQEPSTLSKMTETYAYMAIPGAWGTDDDDTLIPWTPSQADLFAEDWIVL